MKATLKFTFQEIPRPGGLLYFNLMPPIPDEVLFETLDRETAKRDALAQVRAIERESGIKVIDCTVFIGGEVVYKFRRNEPSEPPRLSPARIAQLREILDRDEEDERAAGLTPTWERQ